MIPINPLTASLVLAAGLVLLFLGVASPRRVDPFTPERRRRDSLYQRLEHRLRRAGMRNVMPGFFVLVVFALCALVFGIGFLWTGNPLVGLASLPVVLVGVYLYLSMRERAFVRRATHEMVPFLRKIEAFVAAGRNPEAAIVDAVEETTIIRSCLTQSVTEMRLNRPLDDVLRDSTEYLPLRSWRQFVSAMLLWHEGGGKIGSVLNDAVNQINTLIQLRAELAADYARFSKQQIVILVIAVGAFPLLAAAGLLPQLLGTVPGLIALLVGIGVMVAGFIYARANIKDIERRLDF